MADCAPAELRGYVVARCTACLRQTGPNANADMAAWDWNRRITSGARVVTLFELRSINFDMADDRDNVAVWIETREGELRAVVLSFGIDMGSPMVREYREAMEVKWTEDEINTEGSAYRIWDKKPTKADRAAARWGQIWIEARQQSGEAWIAEALAKRKEAERNEKTPAGAE